MNQQFHSNAVCHSFHSSRPKTVPRQGVSTMSVFRRANDLCHAGNVLPMLTRPHRKNLLLIVSMTLTLMGGILNNAYGIMFDGITATPLGAATLTLDSGRLILSNIGATGDDGVRFELGAGVQGAEIVMGDMDARVLPSTASLVAQEFGQVGANPGQLLVTHTIQDIGDTFAHNVAMNVGLVGPQLTAKSGGSTVLSETLNTPMDFSYEFGPMAGSIWEHAWILLFWRHRTDFAQTFTSPTGSIVEADEIMITGLDSMPRVPANDALTIRARDTGDLVFESITTRAVPEPHSSVLLLLGVAISLCIKRRLTPHANSPSITAGTNT